MLSMTVNTPLITFCHDVKKSIEVKVLFEFGNAYLHNIGNCQYVILQEFHLCCELVLSNVWNTHDYNCYSLCIYVYIISALQRQRAVMAKMTF